MTEHNDLHRNRSHCCHTEAEHDGRLADLLDRCGHYYAHRVGGSRRGQDSVLTWLANNPDATQKEISEGLGVTAASLSEVLLKLERKGYVTRFRDETDHRFIRVRLTEEGQETQNTSESKLDDPFAALSAEEKETLAHLLETLLADWEVRCASEHKRPDRRQHESHRGEHPEHDEKHPGHGRDHHTDRAQRGSSRSDGHRGHGHV